MLIWIRYAVHVRESVGPRKPRARGGLLGRAVDSAQTPNLNKNYFFSNLFYKLQINLNSNEI
jgi:hypothetical protein